MGVSPEGQFLTKEILKAQEQTVPLLLKMSKQVKVLGFYQNPGKKKTVYHMWKKNQATQGEYNNVARLFRRKVKSPAKNISYYGCQR